MSRKSERKPPDTQAPAPAAKPRGEVPAQPPLPEAEPHPADTIEPFENESADEATMLGLLEAAEAQSQKLKDREVTTVRVVAIAGGQVLVDVGEKLEGVVPAADFPAGIPPAVGDMVPVVLEKRGGIDRHAQLSHRKAREILGWQRVREAHAAHQRVTGKVLRSVKGGFIVDAHGAEAFLPLSQADRRPLAKGTTMVGKTVEFLIVEAEPAKRRLVVSRRQVLEQEYVARRRQALGRLKAGQVLEGRVTRLAAFGAFVDLGGIDGLVHNSEISWRPVLHPREALKAGQKVKVKVLKIESGDLKVSLGLKQLQPNPADQLKRRFPRGQTVRGKVVKASPKGLLVHIEGDVNGFIPAEDFVEGAVAPKEGAKVSAVVQGVHAVTFELLLSVRRFEEIQDRERVKQYMRGAPRLTLGEILKPDEGQE